MTSLHERQSSGGFQIQTESTGHERREHRRHDMEDQALSVGRWDGPQRQPAEFGKLVDLSASGVRIRTRQTDVKPDGQIRLRLVLPDFAGICPFVDHSADKPAPKKEWVGWMSISRVLPTNSSSEVDVAGRLIDMDDTDRGMLSLYLSTQPIAA